MKSIQVSRVLKLLLPAMIWPLSGMTQYCTTGVGPSSTIDSNVQLVQLTGNSSSINHTGCPGVAGVQDLTSSMANVTAGSSYTLNVQYGTCGGNYFGSGQVWIDWNQNFQFEATEVIGSWTGTPPTSLSVFNFTVPMTAANGVTRMRVTQQEGGSLPLNPCINFAWGSVMDFSIQVTGGSGSGCGSISGDFFFDPILVPNLPYLDTNNSSVCYSNANNVYTSQDVFYRFKVSAAASNVKVSLCNSSFDTFLSLLDAQGNVLAINDDSDCGSSSEIQWSVSPNDTLYAIVEGYNTANGQFIISIEENVDLNIAENKWVTSSVFPNPATEGEVNITCSEPMQYIQVFNAEGKLSAQFTTNKTSAQLNALLPGYYLIEILTEKNQTLHHKLIVY